MLGPYARGATNWLAGQRIDIAAQQWHLAQRPLESDTTGSVLTMVLGIGSFATLTWMVFRLVRAPRDAPLWSVTGLIAFWAGGYFFSRAAAAQREFLGMAPVTSMVVHSVLTLAGTTCLMYFFLFSALDLRQARRRAVWYALPLVAVATVQITAALVTPAGVHTKDFTVTSVFVLFIVGNLYTAFVFTMTWVWTRRYARKAEPRLARGLRIASFGEAGIATAGVLFIPMQLILRFSGDASPPTLAPHDLPSTLGFVASMIFLLPGVVLFLVGISYKSVAMRVAAGRVWWHHLRAYRQLRPLWVLLHRHFPENELQEVAAGWRDAVSVRGVHRRYYRRVIECRDGLVHISPYLSTVRRDEGGEPAAVSALVDRLTEALRAHAAGEAIPGAAVPLVVPAESGLEADVKELVALSLALRTA